MNTMMRICVAGLLAAAGLGTVLAVSAQSQGSALTPPAPAAGKSPAIDDPFDPAFPFFAGDPFADLEALEKRAGALLEDGGGPWTASDDAARPRVTRTDKEVIVAFNIPGLKGESLNIHVNEARIRVDYDAKTLEQKKDAGGNVYFQSESQRHYESVTPVPQDADPGKNRVVHEGNTLKVIFDKRGPKRDESRREQAKETLKT